MLFNKKLNLLNYNERNLFSVDSNGEFDPSESEEFLIFDGYKIHLKKKPKSQNLRICIGLPSKKKWQKGVIKIEVSHPPKAKPEVIMDFCQKHKEWIAKTCARYETQIAKTDELLHSHGGKILLFGEWIEEQSLALIAQEFLAQMHKSDSASNSAVSMDSSISQNFTLNPTSSPAIKPSKLKTTKQMLSFILLCHIKERAQALAKQMQLEYSKVAVRETFTRFGSCTQNRLSFSLLLICASKPQIEYVIIHELAHIVHKNHSHRFWNLVEKHCKEWRALRKSLQDEYSLFRLVLENL